MGTLIPYNDVSGLMAVSNTALTKLYSLTVPTDKELVLQTLAVYADATMISNGTLQIYINGQPLTSQGSASSGIALSGAGVAITMSDCTHEVTLQAGENISIWGACSSGTGHVNILTSGWLRVQSRLYPNGQQPLGQGPQNAALAATVGAQ